VPEDKQDASRVEALEARIVDLETKTAFQDRTIDELDGVVRDYTERIESLVHELDLLRKSLSDMRETGPADEKPPHY
jgi:uncharacterized coiled-coil protein SlyX